MTKSSPTFLLAAIALSVVAGFAGSAANRAGQRDVVVPEGPWLTGNCYRVFPHDRDQFYVFKVLGFRQFEPAIGGPWIQVESYPPPLSQPGARPPAPLWLNTQSLFAVQAWTCKEP
jgi:hypothetical protein